MTPHRFFLLLKRFTELQEREDARHGIAPSKKEQTADEMFAILDAIKVPNE